jgi:peroxiredoxin
VIKNKKVSGLILTIAALSIFSACNSSTATVENANKKGRAEETAKANTEVSPAEEKTANNSEKPKTYQLPAEIVEAELKTLDGKAVKLSDYKGKVVLLNQWATWCGPCRDEIPELISLREELKGQGFEVIGLTYEDERNTAEDVKDFVQEQQINYPVVWSTETFWGEFGSMARFSVPASFVINKEGQLTAIFVGFNAARTPKSVRKAVNEALNPQS